MEDAETGTGTSPVDARGVATSPPTTPAPTRTSGQRRRRRRRRRRATLDRATRPRRAQAPPRISRRPATTQARRRRRRRRPATATTAGDEARRRRRRRRRRRPRRPEAATAPPADDQPELPDSMREGRATPEAAERALVRKPQIGDTRPAPRAGGRRDAARRRRPTLPGGTSSRASRPPQPIRSGGRAPVSSARRAGQGVASADTSPTPRSRAPPRRPRAAADRRAHVDPHRRHGARRAAGSRAQRTSDRPLPDVRAGPRRNGPGGRARGSQPHRALRVAPVRRRQPDPRQHLRRPDPERAPRHGGGLRRHRHAEERGAVPRRRPVRRRGHRREGPADRGHPAGPPAHRLPGHEEPDRRQGRPPHPGGVAAGSLRRADPELEDVRHLEAASRRRAQAPPLDPRPGEAGRARLDRADRRRARHRGRTDRRHAPAAVAVGADLGQGRRRPRGRRCCTASRSWRCG